MSNSNNERESKFSKKQVIVIAAIAAGVIILGGIFAYILINREESLQSNNDDMASEIQLQNNINKDGSIDNYNLVINCSRNNKKVNIVGKDIDLKYVNEVKKTNSGEDVNVEEDKNSIAYYSAEIKRYVTTVIQKISYNSDKLKKLYDELSIFSKENVTEPKNATIKEENGKYVVEKEVVGNKIDKDKLFKLVEESIKTQTKEINVEESKCYINPQITSDSDKVAKAKSDLEKYSKVSLTYNVRNNIEKLDAATVKSWLSVDNDLNVVISDSGASNFVQGLANKYDDVKYNRIFKTSKGTEINFNGDPYGWKINVSEELNQLFQIIRQGKSVENREPVYALKGTTAGDNGIGNNYIEIDLTGQQLWMYINGNQIVDTPIVSGDASGRYSETENYETPAGLYHMYYKTMDAVLTGPGYASPVKYWMPFNGGIGLHDATWRKEDEFGGEVYKTEGQGGSHGCINLPTPAAATIYDNSYAGIPIILYR